MNTHINKPFIALESRQMNPLMRIAHYPHRAHTFVEFMFLKGASREVRADLGCASATAMMSRTRRSGDVCAAFGVLRIADDMNMMMSKVVEQGTARRAILDGIKAGGKTGTTNAYRDAWFVGFTGNFIAGVWFGNDDFTPTNKLTGGALPAQTWHTVMEYAHQGIELKPLPGVPGTDLKRNLNAMADDYNPGKGHPIVLSKKGAEVLTQIEHVLDDATRHLTPDSVSSTAPENDTVASRASTESGVRGN